jgi:uncharacterized protein with PIN domain
MLSESNTRSNVINKHEVDGMVVENCKLPNSFFKKEGTVWTCPECTATYRVEYQWKQGSMAGLNSGGHVWVQIG